MFEILSSLGRNRRLLRDFIVRDLKARYVGSSMGFFWSVIFPIVNLMIYSFVFRIVIRMRWDEAMPTEEVLLLMFAGILVWVSFAESVSRITNSLVDNGNLIQKVVFPSELLAPYLTASSVVNMTLGLPVVIAGVVWFGYVNPARVDPEAPAPLVDYSAKAAAQGLEESLGIEPGAVDSGAALELGAVDPAPGAADAPVKAVTFSEHVHQDVAPRKLGFGVGLLALPVLILLQAVFTVGLGYVLSTLNLFLRDIYHLVGVFLTVWMFATPIFYPSALVEVRGFGWMLKANPMFWMIEAYRDVLLYGAWPDWAGIGLFALIAAATFFLGSTFFRAQRDRFPDLL